MTLWLRNPALLIGACWALTGTWSGAANAVELSLGVDSALVQELNDNLFLTVPSAGRNARKPISVVGTGADIGLVFQANAIEWSSRTSLRSINRGYPGRETLDRTDQYLAFDLRKISELSETQISVGIDEDSTLGLDPTQIGVVQSEQRFDRHGRSVGISRSQTLTERWVVTLAYNFFTSDYDTPPGTGFANSEVQSGSMNTQYNWSERLKLTASLAHNENLILGSSDSPRLRLIDGGTTTSDSEISGTNVLGGFEFELTQSIDIKFSAGAQFNSTRGATFAGLQGDSIFPPRVVQVFRINEASTVSDVLSAKATKRFENGAFRFNYSRTVSPNVTGALVESEYFEVGADRRLTEHLTARMSLSVSDQVRSAGQVPVGQGGVNFQTESMRIGTGINWVFAPSWVLDASYQYADRSFGTNSSQIATSHSLLINVRYQWDPFQL